ncbi:MAG: PDZ domain-containing protein [Bacilli bacterium]|nr:PDZ domain-containing protein [Bacilli bacterium]
MKKLALFLLSIYMLIPISVYAYSDYIMASGRNIGIELKSNNVIVVGSYNIGSYNALKDSDLKLGDKIIKINEYDIKSVNNMQDVINKINDDNVLVTYKRDNTLYTTSIKLYKEDNEYKSGLYVRDTIRGVATLTYIDTENNTFGALGHEILEKSTKSRFEADTGTIFYSEVTGITKSSDGNPGEKNAKSNSKEVYGTVLENTSSGIFGNYTRTLPNDKMYKVAKPEEINLGDAKILTVTDGNNVSEYDINILKINHNSNTKNILFEVTDKELLDKTGGIIQGMSGSPIIQGNKIVGAVNFVVVDKTNKGYGIFITTMLEEAEN